ncbi:hypothetical protein KC340_g175 [Hortaea werneckii]|nr:hypothetical protein KC342_g15344 [Hortaea werneckii]KAI7109737.1 hypothetical protein KC339_g565 [Hortaea werneckii]KAI7237804.1 hypothetical protein KC365_g4634 [Hortaea werneckii]KAI7340701.1 hypothetical protein KC340_g175 [Hortaea werneckii]KAI7383674.1 hypothetical protein KC328_g11158 [Hortaea werneckii]
MDSHLHNPQPAVQAQHNTGFSTDFSANVDDQLRNWKDPEACQQAPPPFDRIQDPPHTKVKTFTAQQKRKLLFWSLVGITIAAFFALALFAVVHWSRCHKNVASPRTSPQNEMDGADVVINIGTDDDPKVSSNLESTSTATATVTMTLPKSSSKAGIATVSVTLTASPSLPTMPSRKETIATTPSTKSSANDVEGESAAPKAMAERLSSIESKNSAEGAAAKTVPLITDAITQRDPSVTILSQSPLCWMTDEHGAAYTGIEC